MCSQNGAASASRRWTKAHELLVKQEIRKDLLALAVRESDAMLRLEKPACSEEKLCSSLKLK